MSRNSPQPECLSDTMVQTWAKRARIQSQRPLSPESALNTPYPLKEPKESSVPTTSGFILFYLYNFIFTSFLLYFTFKLEIMRLLFFLKVFYYFKKLFFFVFFVFVL